MDFAFCMYVACMHMCGCTFCMCVDQSPLLLIKVGFLTEPRAYWFLIVQLPSLPQESMSNSPVLNLQMATMPAWFLNRYWGSKIESPCLQGRHFILPQIIFLFLKFIVIFFTRYFLRLIPSYSLEAKMRVIQPPKKFPLILQLHVIPLQM